MKKLTLNEVLAENNITLKDYMEKVVDMAENQLGACDFENMRDLNDNTEENGSSVCGAREWIYETVYGDNSGFVGYYLTPNCEEFFAKTFEKYEDYDFEEDEIEGKEFERNTQDIIGLMSSVLEEMRDDIWNEIDDLLENDEKYSNIPLFNEYDDDDDDDDEDDEDDDDEDDDEDDEGDDNEDDEEN